MAGVGMIWRGDAVIDKVMEATRAAIDETTAAAVVHAKQNHPWINRTATLEGSIQMRPAVRTGMTVRGEWGSFSVNYALHLELGAPAANIKPYPFLRPAAAVEYPKLAERIRARL